MNLYKVTNGFRGFGPVHVLVVAANEEDALRLARDVFLQRAIESEKECGGKYDKSFYTDLKAVCVFDDLIDKCCSQIYGW